MEFGGLLAEFLGNDADHFKWSNYRLRNQVNGKVYVGLTGETVRKRWNGHVADSRTKKKKTHIAAAIRKHGRRNFCVEWLAGGLRKDAVCELEKILIAGWDTTDPDVGYNLSTGGESGSAGCCGEKHPFFGKHHTEASKTKMAASLRGIKRSAETRAKMSASKRGKKRPPFTDEHRAKMSAAHAGKKRRPLSEETKAKISAVKKGTPAHNRGKSPSEEARRRMSESQTRRWARHHETEMNAD